MKFIARCSQSVLLQSVQAFASKRQATTSFILDWQLGGSLAQFSLLIVGIWLWGRNSYFHSLHAES